MRCWYTEENQDADGNRGQIVLNYELDDSDNEEIIEQLCDIYVDGYTMESNVSLFLLCEKSNEMVEIEVNMNDYSKEILERC